MMMPVHELAQLTWEEVRDLERDRTLVVLPVGAIEAHGPHLPLDTDVVIATAMARAGAKRLGARDKVVLILPRWPTPRQALAPPFTALCPFPASPSRRSSSISREACHSTASVSWRSPTPTSIRNISRRCMKR